MSDSKLPTDRRLYEFGIFRLDTGNGLFAGEKLVNLAPKVLQTLTLLVENRGRVISKDEFFEKIWADTFVEDNALSFNISQLRKTLAKFDGSTNFVETIPKRGFRFVADVREISAEQTETEIFINRRQVQEVYLEEMPETVPANNELAGKPLKSKIFNLKTISVFAVAVLLLVLSVGFVRQFRQNRELRSFDSIHSVKLTSWASGGSSSYGDYRASHDGKFIAYSSSENGISEGIFVKQLNGGEDIRVTNDKWNNFSPIWSPDDQQIAFVSFREAQSGIYFCPSLGGTPELLKIIGQGNTSLRSWSKDGSAVFYELEGNLFRLDIAGKESSQITDFPPSKTEQRYFALSPDENQIAFCDKTDEQTDIWLMPVGGGKSARLTNDKDEELKPNWHPDGARIFYTILRDGFYQINLAYADGSDHVQITRGDGQYEMVGLSADGTKIFYTSLHDTSDIWSVNIETGAESAVTYEPEAEFWTDISPDGNLMAFQINSATFVTRAMTKSSIIVRTPGEKRNLSSFGGRNPKWLPDSRRIAFIRSDEAEQKFNIWVKETISGVEKQLTTGGVYPPSMATLPFNRGETTVYDSSPDGTKVVYLEAKRNNVRLASIDGGETTNVTNNDNKYVTFYSPIWSPVGNRIAFVSLRKPSSPDEKAEWGVWLLENENVRKIFFTPESLRFLGWSPDGNKLFLESTEGAMKASPTDQKLLQLSSDGSKKINGFFEKISALSMTLSVDGKSVAFAARRDGIDNIYTASTLTGETKKVTANSNPDFCFGSLEWSRDGKTIYFDKQEKINTISMFDNFK